MKRKGEKEKRGEGKEEKKKKAMVALVVLTRVTLEMARFDRLAEFFGNN